MKKLAGSSHREYMSLEHAWNGPIGSILCNYTFPNRSDSLYLRREISGLSPNWASLLIFEYPLEWSKINTTLGLDIVVGKVEKCDGQRTRSQNMMEVLGPALCGPLWWQLEKQGNPGHHTLIWTWANWTMPRGVWSEERSSLVSALEESLNRGCSSRHTGA